jgi:HAD superfamily hydrolase (TIGR01509 family)
VTRTSALRAVLFDLDGVLVDSYEVWFHLLNQAARDFAAAAIPRELFAACWGQGIAADVERFFPGRSIAEVEAYYHAHFMQQATHLRVDPAAAGVVRALRERGLAQAVVTNTPGPLAGEIVAFAGLALDAIVGGTDVPRGKPAPDMVLEACRRVRVDPGAAVVVGDSSYDRGAAESAKVPFVGLRLAGDHRIEALSELPALLDSLGRGY